ncbi:uncharacterized protein TRIADDRAFT_29202 [Trichoplax adhaerens]|uniref:Protein transport protein Sec24C n=1 Tax=Trichoplax adhaerens TaxID=10228 RepID=B3S4Q3_TRIAD|nr:hypothetical protein TRIADDRAFT_29202 [Trichoplax adhaerens]EDV22255.1 hypothetical protein TRIADDRAFT_29202 [Trichoplax adhaerens]|eukprot:XP_002115410.1 hypothetical protein TRIADDRAFT_29202 [Trichoplax adhaerens]
MPPSSTGQQFPASSQGLQMPPSSTGQQFPPSSQGFQMPPSSTGQQFPPSSQGFQMPPSSTGQQFPPVSQGLQMPPTTGQQFPPSSQGEQLLPPGRGQQYPSSSQGQQYPPSSQGQPLLPPSKGQKYPPSAQGQQMLPPGRGQQYPPLSQGQQLPPSSQGQQTLPPGRGQQFQPSSQQTPPLPQGQQLPPPPHGLASSQRQQFSPQGPLTQPQQQSKGGLATFPPPMQSQTPNRPQKSAINPDAMPNPIDELKNARTEFQTHVNGVSPPPVMMNYSVKEAVNCSPRFLRSSMYNIPISSGVMKDTKLPLSVCIQPLNKIPPQDQLPIVNTLPHGPVRCNRCRAYMNPFMYFINNGQRFLCNLCNGHTDVPQEYFCNVDHRGIRADKDMRPELNFPSYEFIVNQDYCRNNKFPETPAYVFVIDVSYNSIQSGMVNLLCRSLLPLLDNLPRVDGADDSDIRVGIITYDKSIQFYNLKDSLVTPQMLVVADTEDVFIPLLDGFFVKPAEAKSMLQSVAEQIPAMFQNSRHTETVLGQAVKAGFLALKEAERCGKVFLFNTSLPTAEAPGRLKNRDDRKSLGTDKEKNLLQPQIPFYKNLAKECVKHGVGVDLFLFPNGYTDVATIGCLSSVTGGSIYKYSHFKAAQDGARFCSDLSANLNRAVGFDAIMRLRTSAGKFRFASIRPTDFYGNFHMENVTDIELATVDSSKSFNIIIKHDDKLEENRLVHLQVALLYTSINGERRLRIHNISFSVGATVQDVYKSCDLETVLSTFTKIAAYNLPLNSPKNIREEITSQCAQALASYRKHCSTGSPPGQLILPECLKLLPVFINSFLNSDLMRGVEISIDDKSWLRHLMNSMKLESLLTSLYPRVLPLHNLNLESSNEPSPIRCTRDKLEKNGAYFLDNGLVLFLWIGSKIDTNWLMNVFGIPSFAELQPESINTIIKLDNPLSEQIHHIMGQIQARKDRCLKLIIVKEEDRMEPWFNYFLVEDRNRNHPSYVDYLCFLHKQIRELLE